MDDTLRGVLERVLGAGFRIDRELGGGGMSRVFLATDLALDRQVVIKVLSADQSAGVNGARFRREIQLVARLQHPHVVPILSAGDADGALYYIMPFLPGESLRARLAREGPVRVADAVGIIREILDALSFAHANGVIHRDIKPENVLIGGGHAVVADFGVAKALNEAGALTSSNLALGTPAYMAPEQVAADSATDHRADLYAVGVVAYEMLAGVPPFSGSASQLLKAHLTTAPVPLRQRRSDVPEAVADVVMRALEKEPAHRPQSAAEMLADLAAATTPTAAPVAGELTVSPEPDRDRRGARRVWIGAAVAIALAAVGGGAWLAFRPTVMRSAQSLAIAPFSVADGDTALVRLGQNLVTTLSANLDGIGELRVADAMSVLSHARTKGPRLSVEAVVDIARRLGARSAGYGTLTPEGRNVRADLALYEVRNPESPLLRVSATAPIDSIAMLSDSLTWRLLREIWLKGKPPTPNVVAISTRSVVALRHFLDGERAFLRWDGIGADEAYRRAIEADTTFWFAHYRYKVAHAWFGPGPADTTITNRLSRHLAELPPREQRLLRARDSTQTVTDRQRKMKALLDAYPDYAPAVYEYADFIVHNGGLAGWDIRDAIPYYRRLNQFMPSVDLTFLSHYGPLCLMVGDRSCAQQVLTQLDSVITSGPKPPLIALFVGRVLDLALHRRSPSWADSLARLVVADSAPPFFSLAEAMGMLAQQPDLLIEQDRLYERIKARGGANLVEPLQSTLAVGRGDMARLDSMWTQVPSMWPVMRSILQPEVTIPEALILAELQGLRDPSPATADKALALVALVAPDTATAAKRVTGRWIVGASALWRGDTTSFRAELDTLGRDTTAVARTASRSLNALRLGRLGGRPGRAAAAESLLVLERDNGEHFRQPRLYVAIVADRIVGAQWLIEQRRYAPADSLLLYPRMLLFNPIRSNVTFGMTMLLRSQIAEELGNKDDAIAFAKTFLVTFDMAPQRAKPWLDQARDRITRLGGHLDVPQASPVRVR